jgi:hypothetical protein
MVVLLPAAGAAVTVGVLVATLLALSALLGGASAASGCDPTLEAPTAVPGAPPMLQPIFAAAARRYRLGRDGASILAGLTSVESGFGQNMGPSSAGAIGWTQFMPATWARWGTDANHDGTRDPYDAIDAIFSSARLLRASGAPGDWYRALFAYNHADSYVNAVLDRAKQLAGAATSASSIEREGASILVIGDSLEVGTFPELKRRLGTRLTGDFERGRPSSAGIEVLRRLLPGSDHQAILFDLGTNDAGVAELRRSLHDLTQLAAGRRLYLVTVNSPFDERTKNALLLRYVHTHPNVSLIPWHRASRGLDLPDGIHGAYHARAELIGDTLAAGHQPAPSCDSAGAVAIVGARTVSGGGRLVGIPGQPGIRIDARILPDVLFLIRSYHLTITAGYSTSPVHKADGEHPLGLAVDIVPGPGGSWEDVDRLARWAEPVQNAPRPPFRWVGYDGDPNHGRGNHLHLSWNHAPDPSRRPPAAWVQVLTLAEPT